MTLLAGLNHRLAFHREINLGVDLLAAGFYFFLAGRFSSNAFWIIILPLLTAAFYFEVVGAFISVTIMVRNNRLRHPRIFPPGPVYQR
jgi:integral membrane sensor domain MASE1